MLFSVSSHTEKKNLGNFFHQSTRKTGFPHALVKKVCEIFFPCVTKNHLDFAKMDLGKHPAGPEGVWSNVAKEKKSRLFGVHLTTGFI